MSGAWKIRALQIDLARQMETVDYIKHYIDFAGRFDYNTVVFYLEARIRTESFPFPSAEESYSLDEMKACVEHAAAQGVDIIPVVSTLGHVEKFLQHPQLQPLAELREGIPGRFGANLSAFCPSLDETYAFLETYLGEVAAVFPSPYFHIGCDEVWDFACCSQCRERQKAGESHADIFARHLLRTHEIVTGKLGKRCLMWDDMLEEYPAALDAIPADIIQCVWQYAAMVPQTKTHFGQRRWDHRMADFRKRGIEFLIAPRETNARNTETLTDYARRFEPLGGLMTVWERSDSLMLEDYPVMAFAGRRWTDPAAPDGRTVFDGVCAELFGCADKEFLQALWTAKTMEHSKHMPTELARFLRGPVGQSAFERNNVIEVLRHTLGRFAEAAGDDLGAAVLEDIRFNLDKECQAFRLRWLLQELYRCWRGESAWDQPALLAEGRELLEALGAAADVRRTQCARWRPEVAGQRAETNLREARENLRAFLDAVEAGEAATGMLEIHYFLPDFYGAQSARWFVHYEGGTGWEKVYEGQPKPMTQDPEDCPFYKIQTPLPSGKVPARLRMETWGYGGVGLVHARVHMPDGTWVPAAVENVAGKVTDPETVLLNDTFWCSLGEAQTRRSMEDRALADEVHSLEIALRRRAGEAEDNYASFA